MRPPTFQKLRSPMIAGLAFLSMLGIAVSLMVWGPSASASSGASNGASNSASNGASSGESGHHPVDKSRVNRLAGESSPYLLLHQHNPVDWYPWGEEALEKARKEDKPIFLSVGYSTCYWCHVMERESFSNPEIAALMNEHFINIKVDREERPDLDEIYMLASQVLSRGRGGWPNSVFLTPDLKPFFGGTYFPPEDRYGRPGFRSLLTGIHQAWTDKRPQIEAQARQAAETMKRISAGNRSASSQASELTGSSAAKAARDQLEGRFDAVHGGFGQAPKFPTPSNLFLLLHFEGDRRAETMLDATLDKMARGGMYDQTGGGFHRYATDQEWRVPHFEKMLYDNGALLEVYALRYESQADPQSARVLRQTASFIARELTSDQGALWSAIDAETDAREGAFYVWLPEELEAALSEQELSWIVPIFGTSAAPSFKDPHAPNDPPTHILYLPSRLQAVAEDQKMSLEALRAKIEPIAEKLMKVRAERKRPLTDDKVLVDWNGLAIAGLAEAGRVLEEPTMIRQAEQAASFVLKHLRPKGQPLQHIWRTGKAKRDAFLADYSYFVHGLLALHRATGNKDWLDVAVELTDEQVERLWADDGGGFFVAAADPDLLFRSKDASDGARPSVNGVALLNLLQLRRLDPSPRWDRLARGMVGAFSAELQRAPAGHTTLARAIATLEAEDAIAASSAKSGSAVATLEAEARSKVEATAHRSGSDSIRVDIEIAEGWHINANPASDEFLVPTSLVSTGVPLKRVDYPKGESLQASYAEEAIQVYSGKIVLNAVIAGPDPAKLSLKYQPCDHERCLKPVTVELMSPSNGPSNLP